ncbi:MAG: hypothetical protein GY866_07675 [Proteobacteria bacterium]|nr:hypothetical protein [Pseudomonadota bacterium]
MKRSLFAYRTTQRINKEGGFLERLSGREPEISRPIADDLSKTTIAEELFISRSSVKTRRRNVYGKPNVDSRSLAAVKAK